MEKLKVLIADDSIVYRAQIRAALQDYSFIKILGVASNGRLALERASQNAPDLLILDMEMPEMDGLQTLAEIRKRGIPCKVLVLTSPSKKGAKNASEALRLRADDFVTRPTSAEHSSSSRSLSEEIRLLLVPKIAALFPERSFIPSQTRIEKTAPRFPTASWDLLHPKIVVIGASTGGPTVLETIFSRLSPPIRCPILIVQHMPPVFTTKFAERLSKISGIPAAEAVHGERLRNGCIYLAPGDHHLSLQGSADEAILSLDQGPQIHSVRPAVDPLFSSAAMIFKENCLAIVLTGMGMDGKAGATCVKQGGGAVVIQSEESCVVFGMPGAVLLAGAYDRIADPTEIAEVLNEKIGAIATGIRAEGGK